MIKTITVGDESYLLTHHALTVILERELPVEWIIEVLAVPEKIEADKYDSQLLHVLKRIPEYEYRVLRVIYDDTTVPKRIITAYFDRGQKNKL